MNLLIPTRHKARIGREFSYPVGAGELSAALKDSPNLDRLGLVFRDSPVWPASEFRRILRERVPYTIVALSYEPARSPGQFAPHRFVELGMYQEEWQIRVNAVPRPQAGAVRGLLLRDGIAPLRQWLASSLDPGWSSGSHSVLLSCCPGEAELIAVRRG